MGDDEGTAGSAVALSPEQRVKGKNSPGEHPGLCVFANCELNQRRGLTAKGVLSPRLGWEEGGSLRFGGMTRTNNRQTAGAGEAEESAVVVLCPTRIERGHMERQVRLAGFAGDATVRVVQTGIGKAAVVRAVVAARGGLFVLAGACGGLVMGEDVPRIARVVDEHGGVWTPWGAASDGVTVAGVDRIVSTPEEKRTLAAGTGAAIVDMESHAFAAACEKRGVAWTVVRGVSDTPEETLPGEVMGWITPEGETRSGRAALDMLRRPALIGHIVGVMRRSNWVLPRVGRRVVEVIRAWEASVGEGRRA